MSNDIQSVTRRTAPSVTSVDAPTSKAKTKTRGRVEGQAMAPSSGKIPAAQRKQTVGATLRSQGKAGQSISELKASLRSSITDGKSLESYRTTREEVYEQRRSDANSSFETMQKNLDDAEALRLKVTGGLSEIVKHMPRELVAGLNIKEATDTATKTGWLASVLGAFKKKQADKPAISEQTIREALFTQIDLLELIAADLQNKHEVLQDDQSRQTAARVEFNALLEKAVNDFNDVKEVHYEVNVRIDDLKELLADEDAPVEKKAAGERELSELNAREGELTRLCMFLKNSIENYRMFEKNAGELATMTTTVLSSNEISMARAFQNIETQASTAQVIAKIADVLRASDLMSFAIEESQQNHEAVVTWISGKVATSLTTQQESHDRIQASQERVFQALKGANEATAAELRKFSDELLADRDGFEVHKPARLPSDVTPGQAALRQRNQLMEARLSASVNKKMASLGVRNHTRTF